MTVLLTPLEKKYEAQKQRAYKSDGLTLIPPITDPMGKHWDQPDSKAWLIDKQCVLMPKSDFKLLLEYSCSQPTGVYVGKMWKSREIVASKSGALVDGKRWFLRWYDISDKGPDWCTTQQREIVFL